MEMTGLEGEACFMYLENKIIPNSTHWIPDVTIKQKLFNETQDYLLPQEL